MKLNYIHKLIICLAFSLLFFIFLNINYVFAATCLEKYLDGNCSYTCPEDQVTEGTPGVGIPELCGEPLVCCHSKLSIAQSNEQPGVELNVPLFTLRKVTSFVWFIKAIYQYALYIIIPLLILVIIYGGALWMGAGFEESQITKAKGHIKNGFIGLGIVLLSYLLLSMVGISTLRELDPEYIAGMEIETFKLKDLEEADPYTEQTLQGSISSQGQDCFTRTFGSSASEIRSKLVSVPCPGLNTTMKVHQLAADAYKAACAKIPTGLTLPCGIPVKADSPFCWRTINTGTGRKSNKLSNHSFAIAVDVSPWKCGYKDNCSRSKCDCKPNLPTQVINAFKSTAGFRWGGDYKSKCDNMHFEWLGPCAK